MDESPNLRLPYILPAQAQKHVTHNEAIRALDALVQMGVRDDDRTTPPATPADGDRHIVATGATGAWAGHSGKIAAFQDGAWAFYAPRAGWLAWRQTDGALLVFDGTNWVSAGGGGLSLNPATGGLVGINATADTTNRLAVSSSAALFNHSGAGHQLKINKSAATETASVLFQTGFSGRAEFGTTGDDDWHVKVSPDGSTWYEALVANRATGAVTFPNTTLVPDGSIATAKIADNAITNAKLRDSAGLSVIGRSANTTGDPADITAATDGHVLRRSGTSLGFGEVATAGIANDAVTNAKLANMATSMFKGRASSGTGDPEDLTAAQATALLDTFTASLKGLAPASGGGTVNFLRADGSWAFPINAFSDLERALRLYPYFATDFLHNANIQPPSVIAVIASGTWVQTTGTANHPGVVVIRSSTTANSGATATVVATSLLLAGGEQFDVVFQTAASFSNLTYRFGFLDTTSSSDAGDGAYFQLSGSGALVAKTSNNSTRTTSSTIVTLSTSTWYHARVRLNASATSVAFEIFNDSGTSLGSTSITTNIPTASGRETGAGFVATLNDTTVTDLALLDYMSVGFPGRALVRGATS